MFRCDVDGRKTKAGEKATKIIAIVRPKTYVITAEGDHKGETRYGHEIVKEIKVCQPCALKIKLNTNQILPIVQREARRISEEALKIYLALL